MIATVNKWSCERDPVQINCKLVTVEVEYDLHVATEAYQWVKAKSGLLTDETDPTIPTIYVSADKRPLKIKCLISSGPSTYPLTNFKKIVLLS